jgi:hypothetical protein
LRKRLPRDVSSRALIRPGSADVVGDGDPLTKAWRNGGVARSRSVAVKPRALSQLFHVAIGFSL